MKKILLSLTVVMWVSAVMANKEDRTAKKEARKERREARIEKRDIMYGVISYQTEQSFQSDFPGATNVSFERPGEFDEATFTLDGKQLRAYYDIKGVLIGTTNEEAFTDLPLTAQKEIAKQYRDYTVKEVMMFHDNQFNESDMVLYGIAFNDADNHFVRLQNISKDIVVQVTPSGNVSYYARIK